MSAIVLLAASGLALWQFVLADRLAVSRVGTGREAPGPITPTDSAAESLRQNIASPVATLAIADLPDGAVVRLDGELAAGTEFELEPGPHSISIAATGYETITDQFTLIAGERLRYPFRSREIQQPPATPSARAAAPPPAPGFLRIGARPWANVRINDRLVEQVTARLDTLAPGRYDLRFERAGFISVDTTVTVRSGELTSVLIQLTQGTP